ncbi:MAG: CAP domain-containing protein [Oscillospiraceae bacterium]|nr:CAP domain-containing protein [Oscillospiraceae bacterium]
MSCSHLKRITAILLALCLTASLAQAAAKGLYSLTVRGTQRYDLAFAVLALVNKERKALKLKPLIMDKKLLGRAMLRSAELEVYYSHTRPDGSSCFTAFPSSSVRGENIGIGFSASKAIFDAWKASPGHYANIKEPSFGSTGIGCFKGSDGTLYWAHLFSSAPANHISSKSNKKKSFTVKATKSNVRLFHPPIEFSTRFPLAQKALLTSVNRGFRTSSYVFPADDVNYSIKNPNVAKVSTKGKVTPLANGRTSLTMTVKGYPGLRLVSNVSVNIDGLPAAAPYAPPPARVKLKKTGRLSKRKISVSWKRVNKADGYEVQYSTGKKFSSKKTVTVTDAGTTAAVLTRLKKNKLYYVRVRAYRIEGKQIIRGDFSAKKAVAPK